MLFRGVSCAHMKTFLERLNSEHAECPGCHHDLTAEERADGYVWVCNNQACGENAGEWRVPLASINRALREVQSEVAP